MSERKIKIAQIKQDRKYCNICNQHTKVALVTDKKSGNTFNFWRKRLALIFWLLFGWKREIIDTFVQTTET